MKIIDVLYCRDQQTMAVISVTGYLIYGGCFAATISSAIASLVGKEGAGYGSG